MTAAATPEVHVYTPSRRAARTFSWFGWIYICVGIGLFALLCLTGGRNHSAYDRVLFSAAIGAGPVLAGLFFLLSAPRIVVILSPETIQIKNLVGGMTLRLDQIVGRRMLASKSGVRLAFVYLDEHSHRLTAVTRSEVVYDDYFNNWLATIPDLDAIQKEKRRAAGKLHIWEI